MFYNSVNKLLNRYYERMLLSFNDDYRDVIIKKLLNLELSTSIRYENHRTFENMFKDTNIFYYKCLNNSAPWRFNIRINYRNKIIKQLLNGREKVSSWYPNLVQTQRNCEADTNNFYNVDNIINLWINDQINEIYIEL